MPLDPSLASTWLHYARGDLAMAERTNDPRIPLAYLCFHAQQAAEKGLKAVLISRRVHFPKTHSIEFLIGLLPPDIGRPPDLIASIDLGEYAADMRYPGVGEDISEEEYRVALCVAKAVVEWTEKTIGE